MRLLGISVENFLSFNHFEWSTLDPELNLVVGPNGSGKTNILRALRAVVDAMGYEDHQKWQEATHLGIEGEGFTIGLDLEFNTDEERRLLRAFLSAQLCRPDHIRNEFAKGPTPKTQLTEDVLNQFSAHIHEDQRMLDVEWLLKGRLVVAYQGAGQWTYSYESNLADSGFRLDLERSSLKPRQATRVTHTKTLFEAWRDSLVGEAGNMMDDYFEGLCRKLPPVDLRQIVTSLNAGENTYELSFRLDPTSASSLPTDLEFERVAEVQLAGNRYYDARFIFRLLLRRAVVFTDNVRRVPRYDFPASSLRQEETDLSSGENLALHLFHLRTGTRPLRDRYQDIQRTFCHLTGGGSFEVGLDRRPITRAYQSTEERKEEVWLAIWVGSSWGDMPLESGGAGWAEALFLATVVAGGRGKVVLVDEPAQNLHPPVQAALLSELEAHGQNQYLVVTHSPMMVAPERVFKTVRLFLHKGVTHLTRPPAPIDPEQEAKIRGMLRQSTDARALLFGRGVVLCEGGAELGALPVWFQYRYGEPLERRGIAVFSVDGDNNFRTCVGFLQQFRVPWAIVCDGSVIGDPVSSGGGTLAWQLERAGVPSVLEQDILPLSFQERSVALEECGVFTVANSHDRQLGLEAFDRLPIMVERWEEAGGQVGRSKALKGRYIAERTACPPEVEEMFEKILRRLDEYNPVTGANGPGVSVDSQVTLTEAKAPTKQTLAAT